MGSALYSPWPAAARRTYGPGAIGLTIIAYFASTLPVVVGVAVWAVLQGGLEADPAAIEAGLQAETLTVLMPLLLLQFMAWSGLTLVWAFAFERRDLASLGMGLSGWTVPRYALGLFIGLGMLTFMGLSAYALGGVGDTGGDVSQPPSPEAIEAALARPGIVAGLSFAVLVFLIQGGSEEIVFRGWLMSTLSARWGVRAGVIVSSLVFVSVHLHVFASGLWFGIAALTGIGMTGLVFALLALLTRSIWEAVAAHGAFNAAAVVGPTLAALAADPELTIGAAFADVFTSATGQAGPQAVADGFIIWAQAIAAGALCAGLVLVLVMLGRKLQAWKVEADNASVAADER